MKSTSNRRPRGLGVASSLRSERYSQGPRPSITRRFHGHPVTLSNYYIVHDKGHQHFVQFWYKGHFLIHKLIGNNLIEDNSGQNANVSFIRILMIVLHHAVFF